MEPLNQFILVLLAGGRSQRMGLPKGLLEFQNRPWLHQQLASCASCGLERVVIVLGHDQEGYFKQIPILQTAINQWTSFENLMIQTRINPRPVRGSFSSLIEGLEVAKNNPGSFILPIDVPCPSPKVWLSLLENLKNDRLAACIPTYDKRGGHPVLLNRLFLNALLRIPPESPDARLDQQLKKLGTAIQIETSDPRVILNLNSPEEWKSFESSGLVIR